MWLLDTLKQLWWSNNNKQKTDEQLKAAAEEYIESSQGIDNNTLRFIATTPAGWMLLIECIQEVVVLLDKNSYVPHTDVSKINFWNYHYTKRTTHIYCGDHLGRIKTLIVQSWVHIPPIIRKSILQDNRIALWLGVALTDEYLGWTAWSTQSVPSITQTSVHHHHHPAAQVTQVIDGWIRGNTLPRSGSDRWDTIDVDAKVRSDAVPSPRKALPPPPVILRWWKPLTLGNNSNLALPSPKKDPAQK
jgi:hypothetical protein